MPQPLIDSLQSSIRSWKDMKNAFDEIDENSYPYNLTGISGGLFGFFLTEYLYRTRKPVLVVVPTEKEAEAVRADLDFSGIENFVLPWWGSLAYRPISPTAPVFSERAEVLIRLLESGNESYAKNKPPVFISCQRSFLTPVPPADYLKQNKVEISAGSSLDILSVAELLTLWGYTRVPRVSVRGEFALRGEVLDICLASNSGSEKTAYRIQFDFDKVEKIKSFDIASQGSLEEHKKINLYPVKEVIWNDERIDCLEKNLKTYSEFSENILKIVDALKEYKSFEGE